MGPAAVPPVVIAEIGCNHGGDVARAREMISVAASFCGVDSVKLQKRDPRVLLSPEQFAAPHPEPGHAFGATYGAHREFLELTVAEHVALRDHAAGLGVVCSASVWDLPSAVAMMATAPAYLKVPSATNLHDELLLALADGFAGDIHVSLGMTSQAEERDIVALLDKAGALHRVVLYACTSGYPVPFDQLALREVERLVGAYGGSVRGIGFSGHHLGIAADVAALALGAGWFERHFTLDRTSRGTDHAASLEPDGLRRLTRDLRAVATALTFKETEILPVEEATRAKLKWLPAS